MSLPADEFIRRFLLHVLPSGFVRIRHYGFLGNRTRVGKLFLCRQLLGVPALFGELGSQAKHFLVQYEILTGTSLIRCPACHAGAMIPIERLPPIRAAPSF